MFHNHKVTVKSVVSRFINIVVKSGRMNFIVEKYGEQISLLIVPNFDSNSKLGNRNFYVGACGLTSISCNNEKVF